MHPDALALPQPSPPPPTSSVSSFSTELNTYLPHIDRIHAFALTTMTCLCTLLSVPILFLAFLPPSNPSASSYRIASLDVLSPYTLAATTSGATIAWNAYLLALGQSSFLALEEKVPFSKTFGAAALLKANMSIHTIFAIVWAVTTQFLHSQARDDRFLCVYFMVKRACLIGMRRVQDGYERIQTGGEDDDDDQFGCV
ncbi:hypothetical protein DL96DRAFT_1716635 [Flagelloscypha sp. PMI_526]|nr:hypothetical protein DL96DRAFT_1716635 [Flagelloscypha sp. PMI_526]